jgi:hypothetical protein
MPVNYVPTFQMPSEYERQVAEARRRQAMAEALEAQAYRPLSGSDAPTPAAAPLVSALQSFMSARQRKKAMEAATKAEEMESTAGKQIAGRLRGGYVYDPKAATPAAIPEQTELEEFQPTSQYRQDVEGAMGMAMTPVGTAALKRAPMLAAALERSMSPAEMEEFGTTVVRTKGGKGVIIGKRGSVKELDVELQDDTKGSQLAQLIAERANLKPGDPAIAYYDAAIAKETTRPTAPVTNIYGTSVERGVDEQGNPVFFQTTRTGGAPSIVPGVRPAPTPMNESQAKAAGFADRLVEASPMLDTTPPSIGTSILSDLPGGNFALTPEQQSFLQAERNFINAVLRRESGAVISDEEFSNARKQYIPQPGDSARVLEQKRLNRETVQRSFMRDAGPSYQPVIDLPPRR